MKTIHHYQGQTAQSTKESTRPIFGSYHRPKGLACELDKPQGSAHISSPCKQTHVKVEEVNVERVLSPPRTKRKFCHVFRA